MPRTRKSYAPILKGKVTIEAIKGSKTVTQIARTFHVHPNLVAFWKKQRTEHLPEVFSPVRQSHSDIEKDQLFE